MTTDWRLDAVCRNPAYNPDWWTGGWPEIRQAVWVCRTVCPVRTPCRRWAEEHRRLARDAVYGGLYWSSRHPGSEVRPFGNQPVPQRPYSADGQAA